MKLASVLLMMIFLAKGCGNELRKESTNISFEYEALTRGSYNKIIAKQDTIITIKDRVMSTVVESSLKKRDWNTLLTLLEKIDRTNVNNLKAPSDRRTYDGALMANLKVIYKDKVYESSSFDHGNPPEEIEKLVNKIIALSDLEKEKTNGN